MPPLSLPVLCLPDEHRLELERAFSQLEDNNLIKRLSDYTGRPVSAALQKMPRFVNETLQKIVLYAMWRCLDAAVFSAQATPDITPNKAATSFLAGVSGGLGGLFGALSLPIELPVTTTIMLRAIAEIAQQKGEDLSTPQARLACLEVFALGSRSSAETVDFGYYASRIALNQLARDGAVLLTSQGAAAVSSTVFGGFIREVSARFSAVVSQKAAASATPLVGAMGGAALNILFMKHFQTLAEGHFTVRRLERLHGAPIIRNEYIKLFTANRTIPQSGS